MGKDDLSQLLGQRRANKDVDSSALIYILFLSCYFARRYQSSWHVENKLNVQIFSSIKTCQMPCGHVSVLLLVNPTTFTTPLKEQLT